MKISGLLIAMVLSVMSAGCVHYTLPSQPAAEMTPAQRSFDNVWQASQYVLRKYYFTLDREDRRSGTMTTEAMTGRQILEWWRRDAVTWEDTYESSLHTIYRLATVKIVKNDAGEFEPTVHVVVGRSNLPKPRVVTLTDAYQMPFVSPMSEANRYRREEESREGAAGEALEESVRLGKPIEPVLPSWLTVLGRDGLLENSILVDIKDTALKRSYLRGIRH